MTITVADESTSATFAYPFSWLDLEDVEADATIDTEVKAELALSVIMPSDEELLELADKHPPAPEWFEGEEERPF